MAAVTCNNLPEYRAKILQDNLNLTMVPYKTKVPHTVNKVLNLYPLKIEPSSSLRTIRRETSDLMARLELVGPKGKRKKEVWWRSCKWRNIGNIASLTLAAVFNSTLDRTGFCDVPFIGVDFLNTSMIYIRFSSFCWVESSVTSNGLLSGTRTFVFEILYTLLDLQIQSYQPG